MRDKLKLAAEWTDDCQGKKDYDGDIVSISTRYWPAGGSTLVFNTAEPEKGLHRLNSDAKPSATSSLVIWFDAGDYRDSVDLIKQEFEADTPEEVQKQVEAWAQEQMDKVVSILREKFGK
jgi:hypothetical protein